MNELLCKLGLRFPDKADERAFYTQFATRYLGMSRLALALGALLHIVFIWWDRIIDPVGAETTMWIRAGLVVPICLGCAAALRFARVQAQLEPLVVGAGVICTAAISVICAILDGGYDVVAAGLMLSIMFVYSIFRLRTVSYLIFAMLTAASYFVGLLFARGHADGIPLLNTLMINTALFTGLIAVVSRELNAREEFRGQQALTASHARVEELLHSMLPADIVRRIQSGETVIADRHASVSIVFSDLVGFTDMARRMPPEDVVGLLNKLFSAFDRAADAHGMHKIKTIGDAYMAVGGLVHRPGEPPPEIGAAELAFAMLRRTRQIAEETGYPLNMRIGLHVGPVVAGVIGTSRPAFDCWGDTVNLASRLETSASPGAVLISESAWQLLRNRFDTEVVEDIEMKGIGRTTAYLLIPPSGVTRPPSMMTLQ